MDNLARPEFKADFGGSFVGTALSDGSILVVKPLMNFLGDRGDRPDWRSPAKNARAALIADIAHFINISHGRHPGVVDHVAHKIVDDAARKWLIQAIDAFAAERRFLNALTVAAGPIRRHVGQDRITALITGQSKNFHMLATSDRKGCPAGAALAFVIDWHQTRPLLDRIALHLEMEPPKIALPDIDNCAALAEDLAQNDSYRRAMGFGAEQLLAQQRGLWQLIAARHTEMLAE
ncbi:MAG: hypothetical protein ABI668_12775 [Sphingorhabdus sp.]